MAMALIDNGTLDLIVQHLEVEQPYPWSTENVLGVSAMLLGSDDYCLAPGLGNTDRSAADDCDWLAHRLLGEQLVRELNPIGLTGHRESVQDSLDWADVPENLKRLGEAVSELQAAKPDYKRWIEWAMTRGLAGYSTRHRGMVESIYLPVVSKLLDLSTRDAARLLNSSRSIAEVRRSFEAQGDAFHMLEERYRRKPTIITTNLDYPEWQAFLGNKALVEALLSRLRHQCHTIRIDGPSLRDPQG